MLKYCDLNTTLRGVEISAGPELGQIVLRGARNSPRGAELLLISLCDSRNGGFLARFWPVTLSI